MLTEHPRLKEGHKEKYILSRNESSIMLACFSLVSRRERKIGMCMCSRLTHPSYLTACECSSEQQLCSPKCQRTEFCTPISNGGLKPTLRTASSNGHKRQVLKAHHHQGPMPKNALAYLCDCCNALLSR